MIGLGVCGLFVGVPILALTLQVTFWGWDEADHLHKAVPFCPQDGKATWETKEDIDDKASIVLAQDLLAKRGWSQIRVQDFGHIQRATEYQPKEVHFVTISAHCNPEAP
ncbi:MAG: hypothetical protein LC623_03995 [Halobacteriales archaeon]|nr:hypothetical protein [Halobacteriales archaeon]